MSEKKETLEERARKLDRAHLDKIGEAVSINTRSPFLSFAEDTDIRCPLCLEKFEKRIDNIRSAMAKKRVYVLVCHTDKIGILEDDPFVNSWEGALQGSKIDCPGCNAQMRFFCTSRPFVKAKCPIKRCGATLTSVSPKQELGLTIIPGTAAVPIEGPTKTPEDGGLLQ